MENKTYCLDANNLGASTNVERFLNVIWVLMQGAEITGIKKENIIN
jgi:hypothetical protein